MNRYTWAFYSMLLLALIVSVTACTPSPESSTGSGFTVTGDSNVICIDTTSPSVGNDGDIVATGGDIDCGNAPPPPAIPGTPPSD